MHPAVRACLTALLLAGCVDRLAQRQAFLDPLIGKPEADLVVALGVPARTIETDGRRFLAYTENRRELITGPAPVPWAGAWAWGGPWAFGGGLPAEIVQLVCETTFEIVDGRVRGYQLRGNACG